VENENGKMGTVRVFVVLLEKKKETITPRIAGRIKKQKENSQGKRT